MKYYEDGQWKDIQIKVANAIQNEYGTSQSDGYSQEYLNDHTINVGTNSTNYRVNFIKGKNLFSYTLFKEFTNSFQYISLELKPNTNYTMSSNYLNANDRGNLFVYNSSGSPSTNNNNVYEGQSRTITTNDDGIVNIAYRDYDNTYTNEATTYWYQLEEGSTATPYEPYINPEIYLDGYELYSKPVVLWQNPNDTIDFTGQITLNDDLTNYSYYEVIYKRIKNGSTYSSSGRCPADKRNKIDMADGGKIFERTISVLGTNTITFGDTQGYSSYAGTGSVSNGFIIPYQIIGYK